MTRDAEHTPTGYEDAASVVVNQAPAPSSLAVGEEESAGDMLQRLGMDGHLWAEEFRSTAIRLGYPDMDEGWLIGWFCNAVMAGYDHAQRRYDPILKSQLAAITGEGVCSLSDAIDQLIGDAIANGSVEVDSDGAIGWCKPALEQTLIASLAGCGYGLAALSPEAPAREGSRIAELEFELSAKTHTLTIADEQIERLEARIKALTPRHEAPAELLSNPQELEAPAEGAGEDCITTQSLNDAASDPEWCAKWNREPPEEWSEGPAMTVTLVRHQVSGLLSIQKWDGGDDFEPGTHVLVPLCLAQRAVVRARSSAPEAREEALGNLLAVIHGDGGHRALEVGVEQAAAEAEKIVARLLSSAPEAREGDQPHCQLCGGTVEGWFCQTCEASFEEVDGLLVLKSEATHPAAPSADKLREFGQHTNLELSYHYSEEGDSDGWQVHRVNGGVNDREWDLIGSGATPADAIDQALAALKAEDA